MRGSWIVAVLGGLAPHVNGALQKCNADNCLRSVRATAGKPGAASASAYCVSFFERTVTPCPSTVTVTALVTSDLATSVYTATSIIYTTAAPVAARDIEDRDIIVRAVSQPSMCPNVQTNSAVPKYASACSGTARYSSACSCVGATIRTVTASPPPAVTSTLISVIGTTTVTTAQAFSTVTVAQPSCTGTANFILQATTSNEVGQFLTGDRDYVSFGPQAGATTWTLRADGAVLMADGSTVGWNMPSGPGYIYDTDLSLAASQSPVRQAVMCSFPSAAVNGMPRELRCAPSDGVNTILQGCAADSRPAFNSKFYNPTCKAITLYAITVC
ncbi:hypothetical protein AUEXF2481DRAFT_167640 [Aureobasidium subglaciale EXF-2481]|uniref:Uncharacterized protein n=1 Tax=Aureobasidium subglaciale (strain EXF-2481) TaxID=1043005 RepID=A0A074YXQ1_AURSE|nr:uncharacterized protein AUEXF2481DRAFT_167640 [Aureobasidium subglaciale EXF-2481]KER00925.1 hypothetical protein AUEXF2481DRAFT_167640 [Aureobasidium subglaciale EXF-2481]